MTHDSTPTTHQRTAYRLWTLGAGLLLGLAAILSLPLIFGDLGGDRGVVNWFTIFLGSALAGGGFWWLLIQRPRQASPGRGALAGGLAALLAYPLVFLVMLVLLGEAPLELRVGSLPSRIAYALLAAFFAVAFGGWFTLVVGAAVGAGLGWAQRRLLPATQRTAGSFVATQTGRAQASARRRPWLAGLVAIVGVAAVLLGALGAWIWFAPLNLAGLERAAAPVADYGAAVAAIEAQQAAERAAGVNPVCESRLLSHGDKAERVVVLLHGFTNCPAQYTQLAQQLYYLGDNVYIPRLPGHGLADRMTPALADLSAEELASFAGASADIAQGLGEHVTVVGLSGGGNVAAWLAQERSDVDAAVLIAPMLGILKLPEYAVKPVANAALTLPDFFIWWDAAAKEQIAGPAYAYPRYATKAVAALLRLSAFVDWRAGEAAPATGRILVVTNAADPSVNNAVVASIMDKWRARGGVVDAHEFAAALDLPHDIIDPNQPDAQIEHVYPILVELVRGG
ncbi:MAG: alpha/beta hydrolase [Caldilinea sp.]|nr:alpha/beta hydrolase [Caldilinea sp.]MCB0151065.1 alpha/beta hydrolase [Caldilineaceae bacterium]MCB9121770.1 alpha/beta hydrolase [Caldilineaceae bacterium]MCO5212607.1 alpha/beta hydrolase [Caldilinea sp.]